MVLDANDDLEKAYEELKASEKKRHSNILGRLRDLEEDSEAASSASAELSASTFLPSSMLTEKKKDPKDKADKDKVQTDNDMLGFGVYDNENYDPDAWFDEMVAFQSPKVGKGKRRKNLFDSDGILGGKKKKKKKKNADGVTLIDFKKEFEPDIALFKNLLMDQNKFTESLQKQYNYIQGTKSSARGVNKQLTDLVENITQARSLSMQLVDKNVQIKKLVAELTMKQRKELGGIGEDDQSGLTDFASSYMRSILDNRRLAMDPSNAEIVDMDEDVLFDELDSVLASEAEENSDLARDASVDKYLQYENDNVSVHVSIPKDASGKDDIDNYTFEAYAENGTYIDDYPLPTHSKISVNRSTNIATDTFGNKYPIIWAE